MDTQIKSKERVAAHGEVFTAPREVNAMLDLVKPETERIDSRFLEPACGDGNFLIEILRRKLSVCRDRVKARQYTQLQYEHDAIWAVSSIYGIELLADNVASCRQRLLDYFTEQYKALFKSKCKYCGASQAVYDRGSESEQYAYMFIHTDDPGKFFNNMKFDVIIGNPPYQLSDGENRNSASPIYQLFVEQAKKLSPRYLLMIIPSRWYCGGRDLGDFRQSMLKDGHLRFLYDYKSGADCFPGIRAGGGVCYFLWDKGYESNEISFVSHGEKLTTRNKIEFGFTSVS